MDKLINIIGIAKELPAGVVLEGATVSDSGLYLADADELNLDMISAKQDASEGNLFELMQEAKLKSFDFLKEAILAGLTTYNRPALSKYIGYVGSPLFKGSLDQEEGSVQRLTINTRPLVSAYMKVKRIGLIIDSDASVDVNILGIGRTFTVVATANTPSFVDANILIPINGEAIELEYTVAGFQAKKNVVNCGCTAKDNYLAAYFEKGFYNQDAKGIILDAEVFCLQTELIELNYELNEGVAACLARSVYYKSLELLVEKIINSGDINRYTMLDTNHLYGKRNHFRKEFNDRINWMVGKDGFDMSLNSCFICGSKAAGTRKSGIMI